MAAAAAQRKYERLHTEAPYHDGTFTDWRKESSDSHPFHFLDGVTIWAAEFDVNPDDQFLGGPSRPDPAGEPGAERW